MTFSDLVIMFVDNFFSLGVLTITTVVCCALCPIYPSHRNTKSLEVLQHPQAPTCLQPWLYLPTRFTYSLCRTITSFVKWCFSQDV